jgi:hypothetical protein
MDPGVVGVFIPIVSIIFGIGIGMLAIWSDHKRRSQLLEQSHKERMAALEKGLPMPDVPAGLVGRMHHDDNGVNAVPRAVRNGLVLVGVGAVLFFALTQVAGERVALFGLLPAAIGMANLVYAWMLARKSRA